MRAWLKGGNSDFREAQYHQFCRDGYVFSIVEFALVPFFAFVIAFLCCCFSPANGIKGNKFVCQDDEDVAKDEEKRLNVSQERKLMRRVTSRTFSNSKIQRSVDRPVEKPKPDPSARIDTDMPMMN